MYLSREDFERSRADGAFLESAEVHGELYGTPRGAVEELLGHIEGAVPIPLPELDAKLDQLTPHRQRRIVAV